MSTQILGVRAISSTMAAQRCNICAVIAPLSLFSVQLLVCYLQGLPHRSKSGCSAVSRG